ncbi:MULTISPECIES: DUF4062 domain-containing protein [Mycobacteroides]|uniref:DUF4062 domain-containing protein n=1 Tax=Mycobacteroides TaxID=670516 RepID=UPI00099210E5|nr:DUF4062 domain-containing protein [Mycobacteroides abscessus subsp. massiliense]
MRVCISSARRGLEEERDALPGLISAIGHMPVCFEDFTAQTVPSREACLAGVKPRRLPSVGGTALRPRLRGHGPVRYTR